MIEDALLKYLGIYPEVIERADAIVERACEAHGIDSDDEVWPYVLDRFEQAFDLKARDNGFTNWLIHASFSALDSALQEQGIDDGRIDYYVDGMCSDFYINGKEQ